jgi:very-short-patch-repair endonuclease
VRCQTDARVVHRTGGAAAQPVAGLQAPRMTTRRPRPLLAAEPARSLLRRTASARGGVLHRPEVLRLGVPRWVLQAELRARRWQAPGRQTVVTHNGELTPAQRRAIAVLEVGPRAALDGLTALQHLGVDVEDDGQLHVIAPKGSTPKHPRGVRVHESRRFAEQDVVERGGVRVVGPAVAVVHGALWARSDREAQLCLLLPVQQRLTTPAGLQEALDAVRRSRRRRLLAAVLADLGSGVRSLPELDLARAMRRRGLPEPDRQVLRRRPSGRQYLDCRFDAYRLTVEVDGEQHGAPEQRVVDALRDLAGAAEGDAVVRIPATAIRLDEALVMAALERVLESRGWRRAA